MKRMLVPSEAIKSVKHADDISAVSLPWNLWETLPSGTRVINIEILSQQASSIRQTFNVRDGSSATFPDKYLLPGVVTSLSARQTGDDVTIYANGVVHTTSAGVTTHWTQVLPNRLIENVNLRLAHVNKFDVYIRKP